MQRRFEIIQSKRTAGHSEDEPKAQEFPAFEEAIMAHLDGLFGFALRLVRGQHALAEDLLQEACFRAFMGYKNLRSPEKIRPWLFQILVNTHINEFHRRSREPNIVDIELSETFLESADAQSALTPEEEMFEQMLDGEIQQALDDLPVEFRSVVWLADVEGLSHREIAEIIGCPIGTVASRLYRGHTLLRERLREYARQRRLLEE